MSAEQRIYDVPSISCGHCKQTIEGGLIGLDGVQAVTVDVDGRTVSVTGMISADAVRTTLDKLGYEVAQTRSA